IVQQFHPLPKFGDSYMLIGSWLVGKIHDANGNWSVPLMGVAILSLSGNHAEIRRWRLKQSCSSLADCAFKSSGVPLAINF
ncbi:hypothetical protein O5343_27115, partial [Escherichia coli]|nr:hypothetical protein [Escherichia coli]